MAAPPSLPFWLVQRQAKVEPTGENALLLKAPNLPPYQVAIRQAPDGQGWMAALHQAPAEGQEKPLVAESSFPLPDPVTAWDAAFELYRQHVIV